MKHSEYKTNWHFVEATFKMSEKSVIKIHELFKEYVKKRTDDNIAREISKIIEEQTGKKHNVGCSMCLQEMMQEIQLIINIRKYPNVYNEKYRPREL